MAQDLETGIARHLFAEGIIHWLVYIGNTVALDASAVMGLVVVIISVGSAGKAQFNDGHFCSKHIEIPMHRAQADIGYFPTHLLIYPVG